MIYYVIRRCLQAVPLLLIISIMLFLLTQNMGDPLATLGGGARQLALAPRLRWIGWQNDPGPYYDLADVFVCPSRQEPLGNVILEAWAHRLPVITTRTQGALELVAEEESGLLVEIRDPAALAACITALVSAGPAVWQSLAENGLAALKKHHSEEAVLKAYLALYAELQPGTVDGS